MPSANTGRAEPRRRSPAAGEAAAAARVSACPASTASWRHRCGWGRRQAEGPAEGEAEGPAEGEAEGEVGAEVGRGGGNGDGVATGMMGRRRPPSPCGSGCNASRPPRRTTPSCCSRGRCPSLAKPRYGDTTVQVAESWQPTTTAMDTAQDHRRERPLPMPRSCSGSRCLLISTAPTCGTALRAATPSQTRCTRISRREKCGPSASGSGRGERWSPRRCTRN